MFQEGMMGKLKPFKRRIEILKLLHGRKMRIGDLAEEFNVSDRILRDDITALREGMDLFGVKFKIESSHIGGQKHYYKSTIHPIILGLNLSELLALLKILEEKSKGHAGDVYKNIFQSIYSQMTDYAEDIIAPKLEGKYEKTEIINLLEEEAFKVSKDYKLMFWEKSGNFIEITYPDTDHSLIIEEVRLIGTKGDQIRIQKKDGNKKWINYNDILVDWSVVDYK